VLALTYLESVTAALPFVVTLVIVVFALLVSNWLLLVRPTLTTEARLPRQIAMCLLSFAAIVILILVIPGPDPATRGQLRGQLIGLLGLIVTAIIALASTTFVANAMAGLQLRTVHSFKPGDFVSVAGHFGRVTERGLFHTEIQTEDRDLVTLPNLALVSNPVRVVRSSGTIVSAVVSLGYDIPRRKVEPLLIEAAAAAELEDPFVQMLDLGDVSVSYRTAGFLKEVKQVLTVRSHLRRRILDTLHEHDIEIASPAIMNQRPVAADKEFIPERSVAPEPERSSDQPAPEEMMFDKAESAEHKAGLEAEQEKLLASIKDLEGRSDPANEAEQPALERELQQQRHRAEEIAGELAQAAEAPAEDGD
jgi:small conductance mechanosensitive channel